MGFTILCLLHAHSNVIFSVFCRTGKRSTLGLLKDGVNSSIRYYKNNFADGFRQVSDQKNIHRLLF